MRWVYELAEARNLLAAGWTVEVEAGFLYWLVKGNQRRRLYRTVAIFLGY